ncbi:MAG: citrate transporter [Sphingobacteriales bacterium]|nr:MAG: citrate transporter [Sphingobacteriales bacterium]
MDFFEGLPILPVLPFITILLLIAAGPVLIPHFWHRFYRHICILMGGAMLGLYLVAGHGPEVAETAADYISFICLLGSLFIISGGIHIFADRDSTPFINVVFLIFGAVTANFIGTTGASVLLIRPYILINRYRLRPYHIIFFIFIVSNAGGMLTPLGDPPLFFGFLKGVPFFWNVVNMGLPWLVSVGMITGMFFWLDSRNKQTMRDLHKESGKVSVKGKRNLIGLGIVLGSLFIDPKLLDWVPAIHYHGYAFSFVRELIQIGTAIFFFVFADKVALSSNEFSFEPLLEVVFLFFAIFFTMMPALSLVKELAQKPDISKLITPDSAYWITGSLSSVLDNAPSYINVLAATMAKYGLNLNNIEELHRFISKSPGIEGLNGNFLLRAISVASVMFGAMTYVGNGPNLMVKAIAEKEGVKMPSFGAYIFKYSIPYLLPVLVVIYLLFVW